MIIRTATLILTLGLGSIGLFAQAPAITQQPLSQNAAQGSDVTLSVKASGNPAPAYRWALNGEYIPGATTSQFTLQNLQPADSGAYSVTVFNSYGAVESQEAFLLVDAPHLPATDSFSSRGKITGASGVGWADNSKATRERGELLLTYSRTMWVKWIAPANGWLTLRTEGSTFDTVLGIYSQALNLNLIDDDSGEYHTSFLQTSVKAGQEYDITVAGATSMEFGIFYLSWNFIAGTPPPVFTLQPLSQTVNRGESVMFSGAVDLSGSTFQWFFNDNPIAGAIGKNLTIASVEDGDVGFYTCRATGLNGLATFSATAELQINTEGSKAGTRNSLKDAVSTGLLGSVVNLLGNLVGNLVGTLLGILEAQPKHGFQTMDIAPSSGYSGTQIFATAPGKDPGEPNHCGIVGGASYWLTYSAPQAGRLTLNTDGSTFDTILAVYTDDGKGNGYDSLVPVGCDNNSGMDGQDSKVAFDVQPNIAYYIVVDGVNGATGKVYLNYSLNTAPTLSAISDIAIKEDQTTGYVGFSISDRETAADSLKLSAQSSNTTLVPGVSFAGSGSSRYFFIQPTPNKNGTATITLTVTDGQGLSSSRSFRLTVTAVNDPPVAGADCGTRKAGCSINFYVPTLLSNDSDPDGDPITFMSCASRSNSGGSLIRNGSYVTYYPPSAFNSTDYFTYTISDGKGGTATGRVTVYCSSSSSSIQ
jgi:hypothetical protein